MSISVCDSAWEWLAVCVCVCVSSSHARVPQVSVGGPGQRVGLTARPSEWVSSLFWKRTWAGLGAGRGP